MKNAYDVVVIGSGFGGAITACRLAQAGRSVCMLERGKRWDKQDFPRTLGQMAHAFWNDLDHGLLDYRVFPNIDVIQAAGVGGGSLVYFNVHKRAKPEIFEQPRWPQDLKRPVLDPFYDRAKEILEAQPLTPPAGLPLPARTQALLDAARAAGREPDLLDICVYTGPDRLNPYSGVPQQACVYCGNCMLGCHVHAKNTLDLNYLALAEKNGAEIYPLHEAISIEPLSDKNYQVVFKQYEATPGAFETAAVVARRVVVAAGSLGSTELLLRCRDITRTLTSLSARLGEGFSSNGDALIPTTRNLPREIDAARGPSITAGVDCSTEGNQIYLQDLGIPDPFFWYLQAGVPVPAKLHSLWLVMKEYVLRIVGRRGQHPLRVEFERLFEGDIIRALPYLGMGTDDADGKMRLVDGAVDIVWDRRSSRAMFAEMESALKELSRAINGQYKASPLSNWPLGKLLTAHPLGGCAMSDREEDGVVNEFGEVWRYPGLYVSDGSIIPTALAINPSATISALAERNADHMIRQSH
ncbi:MAG: GMC family oxidoreductase [Deltaproteobacteria bacterium]|nr:GMC family oxidoreductase [Deltaproteobacteria bacterium]